VPTMPTPNLSSGPTVTSLIASPLSVHFSKTHCTSRLWRRYGAEVLGLLEDIREDPNQADILIKGTEYIRCEIQQAKQREMIVKLEDFLRRRSKIALVVRKEEIKNAEGIMEACDILFGDEAKAKLDEYF